MISVILPAFNRCEYLKPTLMALSSQKVSIPVEIIVVDSGADNTSEMIEQFFPDVIYSTLPQQKNRSLVRNEGARISNGEYLIFIDNDMIVTPGYLEAHYQLLSSNTNSVGLSKRLSLEDFSAQSYPLDKFSSDLEFLKDFPGTKDMREADLNGRDSSPEKLKEGWIFCFSHGLSMSKEVFEKSGQFDGDFGENWGLEDVELGYRLAQQGATFFVLDEAFAYHQPHGEQSNNNLVEVKANEALFLKKHPFSDVEIILLYSPLNSILNDALAVRDTYMNNFDINRPYEEDLILGYLFSYNQKYDHKRFKLGVYFPEDFEKVEKARIIKEAFYYDQFILLDIVKNGLDYAQTVIIEKKNENSRSLISDILDILGYVAEIEEHEQVLILNKTGHVKSKMIRMFMPAMDQPRQRHFNYSLALLLKKNGYMIIIIDPDFKDDPFYEDFLFNSEENDLLSYMFLGKYRKHEGQLLISKDEFLHFEIKVIPGSFIMDDLGFSESSPISTVPSSEDEKDFKTITAQQLDLMTLFMASSRVSFEKKKIEKRSFLVFMQNGFYEESMDIVLEGFSKIISDFKDATLIVKVFDYYHSFQNAGLEFNDVTREHTYHVNKEKFIVDLGRLKAAIYDLNLEKHVEIVSTPLSLDERKMLYKRSSTIISLSKDHFVGIEAYESLISGNSLIVGEHKILHPEISASPSVHKVSSQRVFYSEAMHRPFTPELAKYSAYQPHSNSFEKKLRRIMGKNGKSNIPIELPVEIRNSKSLLKDFLI